MSSLPTLQPAAAGTLPSRAALPVFVATIGLSAFLLFSIQPLFAKLVLPVLGGSPAVWSVATVVFQCLLLAGYAYAHALAARSGRTGVLIHLGVLVVASLSLPIGLAQGWQQAPAGFEALWLAALVLVSVGLPFFAVAANGPLLQAWFARTGHRRDPYFLYAASNIGSFAALIAYPLLIEPVFRLRDQIEAWSFGFAALIVLIGGAGAMTLGHRAPAAAADTVRTRASWKLRLVWVALAAAPSGLLVAVTAHISTDIAPTPLLWLLPLGLYLLSFVVAFGPANWLDDPRLGLLRVGITAIVLIAFSSALPFWISLALHLGLFTLTALACHRVLFRLRPEPSGLTGFYLALSVGGALGGLFCGLLAPVLFSTLAEYPIFLVAALACRADLPEQVSRLGREAAGTAAVCAIAVAATAVAAKLFDVSAIVCIQILMIAFALVALTQWRSIGTSCVAAAAIALAGSLSILPSTSQSESIRSFFGIHRIGMTQDGRFRTLSHGTTLHGAVRVREDDGSPALGRPEPTTYYAETGVIGRAVASARQARGGHLARVSVVGLGTGSVACHAKPGESWSFYEIDSAVVRIARDPTLFPFLQACGPDMPIVLGDARLTLAQAPIRQDLILLDAFSSDAIPIHLLTREAIGLYLTRLGSNGVIVMHVSNRHLELARILARTAAEHGLVGYLGIDDPKGEPFTKRLRASARVMVLARDPSDLGPITTAEGWLRIAPDATRRPWTDDFSNVLEALRDGLDPVRTR